MRRAYLLLAKIPLRMLVLLVWTGCAWEPQAKPVTPQLLLTGSVRVDRALDDSYRFVLLTRDPSGESRRSIIERATKKVCDLPKGTINVGGRLLDPTAPKGSSLFWLPLIVSRENEDRALYYADEYCNLRGPFGRASSTNGIALDGGGQEVSLVGDGSGNLSLVNPWTEEVTRIAENVSEYRSVQRLLNGNIPVGTQALWLLEGGALTQRSLNGELLFTRGQDVTKFEQALFNSLRVAYVDGGSLYEASGPDFQPIFISENACVPRYFGVDLNFFTPCADRQLARIDLTTGSLETFEPGMLWTYEQSGYLFEYIRTEQGLKFFATPPGQTERKLVEPAIVDNLQALGDTLVGRSANDEIVIWNARFGAFPFASGVTQSPVPFHDTRANEVSWVVARNVSENVATLSLYRQGDFRHVSIDSSAEEFGEVIATSVPTNGYSVVILTQVSEVAFIFIEDAEPVSDSDSRLRGRLRARLASGALGAVVDEDVTSYATVYIPLQGIVYSVEKGDRTGLWFAAL